MELYAKCVTVRHCVTFCLDALMARGRRPFRGGNPSRLDRLVTLLGGPFAAARFFGVCPSTLFRWRTAQWPLTERRAEQLRAVALDFSQEMTKLAYDLKQDAAEGRRRAYRHKVGNIARLAMMPGRVDTDETV
jgi:hypothetical protein